VVRHRKHGSRIDLPEDMFLIDDILLFPTTGLKFIFRTLQQVAEQEYTDTAPLKARLLELQVDLENGDLTEDEYVAAERGIILELREIEKRKRELAGAPTDEAAGH